MARGGQGLSMSMLVSIGVGILAFAIDMCKSLPLTVLHSGFFMLAPVIPEEALNKTEKRNEGLSGTPGGQMENAMPALDATSDSQIRRASYWPRVECVIQHQLENRVRCLGAAEPIFNSCRACAHGGHHHFRASGSFWRGITLPPPRPCHTSGPPLYGGIAF